VHELHADQLSGAPSDCESGKSSNGDDIGPSTSQKGRKMARLEASDSDVNIENEDEVDDGWTENVDLRNLEQFLGNSGLTVTPGSPNSTSE
jgi:hypothetical protein